MCVVEGRNDIKSVCMEIIYKRKAEGRRQKAFMFGSAKKRVNAHPV